PTMASPSWVRPWARSATWSVTCGGSATAWTTTRPATCWAGTRRRSSSPNDEPHVPVIPVIPAHTGIQRSEVAAWRLPAPGPFRLRAARRQRQRQALDHLPARPAGGGGGGLAGRRLAAHPGSYRGVPGDRQPAHHGPAHPA